MHSIIRRPLWHKILILIGSVSIAIGLSFVSQKYFPDQFVTAFGIIAVFLCGVFGGAIFGILAALLSGLLAIYFLVEPRYSLFPQDGAAIARFVVFVMVSMLVVAILHRLQRYAADLEAKEIALLGAQRELKLENNLRKQAELHYAQEANRFETVLSGILDAVISINPDGVVQYVNAAATGLLGISQEACLGKRIPDLFDVVSAETGESLVPLVDISLRNGIAAKEASDRVLVTKNGTEVMVEVSAAPLLGIRGEILGAVSIIRDIREKRAAEERLRDYEQRFRLATEAANIGVWVWEPVSDHAMWNRCLTQMVGLGDFEYQGTAEAYFQQVHSEDRDALRQTVSQAIAHKESFYSEIRFRRSTEDHRWFAVTGSPVYDQRTGDLRMVAGINLDITDRKVAEAKITGLNENLEDLAMKLSVANQQLQERTEWLETILTERAVFLSSMSHELRTPLHSISGFLELLLEEGETGSLNERQRRYVRNIEGSAQHLIRVVSDVLDLSRISAGRLRLSPEVFPLRELSESVVTAFLPIADEHEVHLSLCASSEIRIYADRERVRQILTNLISNAVKFTPAGGEVKVKLQELDGRVLIAVEDTGVGIPQDDVSRIFGEFEQVHHQGFRPKLRGSGLGLAITKKLIELQQGTVEVESVVGQGSEFRVWLPAAEA
jgi:PAS domain S-box-containing protein